MSDVIYVALCLPGKRLPNNIIMSVYKNFNRKHLLSGTFDLDQTEIIFYKLKFIYSKLIFYSSEAFTKQK